MATFLVLSVLLLPLGLLEDTVFLSGMEGGLSVKVLEMRGNYVTVIVSKDDIGSVSYSMNDKDDFPDVVTIYPEGVELKCRAEDAGDGTMVLDVRRDAITAVNVSFDKEGKKSRRREKMEDAALAPSAGRLSGATVDKLKEELRRELLAEMRSERQLEEKAFTSENTGRVEGTITQGKNPLPGCKVKMVLLVGGSGIMSRYVTAKDREALETVTNEEGHYTFEEVLPGGYKLFWMPPWENSWIRRMRIEPDVFVEPGETAEPKNVNAGIAPVN
ncbi:MAG: carboxypeptidase-like regulatory domain-containing protein [Candidatus Brocadiales bacterium]